MQERGINESLAGFIPEYAEHKEQKASPRLSFLSDWSEFYPFGHFRLTCRLKQEYVNWLQNVKQFVEA